MARRLVIGDVGEAGALVLREDGLRAGLVEVGLAGHERVASGLGQLAQADGILAARRIHAVAADEVDAAASEHVREARGDLAGAASAARRAGHVDALGIDAVARDDPRHGVERQRLAEGDVAFVLDVLVADPDQIVPVEQRVVAAHRSAALARADVGDQSVRARAVVGRGHVDVVGLLGDVVGVLRAVAGVPAEARGKHRPRRHRAGLGQGQRERTGRRGFTAGGDSRPEHGDGEGRNGEGNAADHGHLVGE